MGAAQNCVAPIVFPPSPARYFRLEGLSLERHIAHMAERRHSARGFTGLEILIVVAILGMVLWMTLKGTTVIPSMRAYITARQIETYQFAVEQYRSSERNLPGDDAGVGKWGQPQALSSAGGGLVSFAGDDKIDGELDDPVNAAGEQYAAWRHLRLGGYLDGDTSLTGQSARPETPSQGFYGFAHDNLGLQQVLCLTKVPGTDARILDKRLDDGIISTGKLRGTSKWDPVGAHNHFSEPDTAPYDPDKTYIICLPYLP